MLGVVALHTGSVETHIPVGEVLEEAKDMSQHTVKAIVVHLAANLLNHALTRSDDPAVHDVCFLVLEDLLLELRIIDEVLANTLLPSGDVLDAEAVRVEPWKEDVPDDSFDTISRELERLSSH